MEFFSDVAVWFLAPEQWQGRTGIPTRVIEHLYYSGVAAAVAIAIGLPIGLLVGHTGKGGNLAINVANVGRALPSFGIIILVVILAGIGFLPVLIALVAFAVPPVLTNTYAGIRAVDPEIRDAAEGMGMRGYEVLLKVELPVAAPLIMAGIRTAGVQTVATATLAAYVGLDGLGRYIINGLALQDFIRVFAGAALVAALAVVVELLLAFLQRVVTPQGLRRQSGAAAADAKMNAAAA